MPDDESPLSDLLKNPELWRSLHNVLVRLRGEWYDGIENPTFRRAQDFHTFNNQELRQLFRRLVVDRLSKPAPITSEDLLDNFRHQLAGVSFDPDSDEFQNAVRCFRVLAHSEADPEVEDYGTLQIELGDWHANGRTDEGDGVGIWSFSLSDNFELNANESQFGGNSEYIKLVGDLCGWCSPRVLLAAEQWVSQYASSIAKTAACCSTMEERKQNRFEEILESIRDIQIGDEEEVDEMPDDIRGEPLPLAAVPVDDDRRPGIPPDGPSPLWFVRKEDQPGHLVFVECFNAVGHAHLDGIDTFTRRLASAVEFLSEADKTDSASVAFVLCFTAIEAMLCEKPDRIPSPINDRKAPRTGTTVQIRKFVPVLLMPSPVGRSIRGEVLYHLYDIRCDIVHRGWRSANALALRDLRQIASGVIRSAIHWRNVQRINNRNDTWDELFAQVNRAAFDKSEMLDIPDLRSLLPGKQRTKHYR